MAITKDRILALVEAGETLLRLRQDLRKTHSALRMEWKSGRITAEQALEYFDTAISSDDFPTEMAVTIASERVHHNVTYKANQRTIRHRMQKAALSGKSLPIGRANPSFSPPDPFARVVKQVEEKIAHGETITAPKIERHQFIPDAFQDYIEPALDESGAIPGYSREDLEAKATRAIIEAEIKKNHFDL